VSSYVENLIKNGKHFCILPWIHFHAWPNGKVMPCCVADSSKPVASASEHESIINMLNTEEYKKMRVEMLYDKPVEACRRCYELEDLGTWTMRQSHNSMKGLANIDLVDDTNEDGSIDQFKMKYMDIRFSNLCNMKCRTCGPECSSLHAQEFVQKRKGSQALFNYFKMKSTMVSVNEDGRFFEMLEPYLADVEEVYFAGGESLQTQEHYDSLEYWINNNLTSQVDLTYTTNFGSLKFKQKDLVELWKKFPKIKIWASLDDLGDRAELIRKGTDWEIIEDNIRLIKKEIPHAEFGITPTISIYNVFTYPKFFEYLLGQNLISESVPPRINLLTNPWWSNIQILPDKIKQVLIYKYQIYRSKYYHNEHIRNGFALIQNNLMQGSAIFANHISKESKKGILEFIEYNDEMDKIRREKIVDIIPELREVYEWAQSL